MDNTNPFDNDLNDLHSSMNEIDFAYPYESIDELDNDFELSLDLAA